jgi:hypothetical protein
VYRQQTIREGIQWLYERPAKDLFRHDAPSLTLAHVVPSSGSTVVVMVQSTHDRNGNHFAPCILRGRNRSALFWDLLLNPLMGSCPVEVHYILLEHALELLLLKNQHVVQAFLPYTPQEALAVVVRPTDRSEIASHLRRLPSVI